VAGKHVLLEKPLEISTPRAEELVRSCREAGVRLGVVLQHRYRPAGRTLARMMSAGRFGALVGASASIRNWRPQAYYDEPGRGTLARDGGGVLLTQAIHTLDLFITLAGQPAEVFAYARTSPVHRMETEDIVAASLRFEGGAMGAIEATTTAYPGFPEKIQLIYDNATATITGSGLDVQFHDGAREGLEAEAAVGGTGADPMAFPHDHHLALITDFLDAVEADRDPPITGEQALKVHYLIDALLQSARDRAPVALCG
jgi:predicted dehydrogenase